MTERERFERFQANEIKMDYEELKRRLDQSEKITGHRYGKNGQFFREWLVWSAATQQKEGYVLVPQSLLNRIVEICEEQANEWDSDAVVTHKNYAQCCGVLIRSLIKAAQELT